MPTKRKRVTRTPGAQATRITVELYRKGKPLMAIRTKCANSGSMCTHQECVALTPIQLDLHERLGLRPWQPSPLESIQSIKTWPGDVSSVIAIKKSLEQALKEQQG